MIWTSELHPIINGKCWSFILFKSFDFVTHKLCETSTKKSHNSLTCKNHKECSRTKLLNHCK
jgi:hypothetical protein